MEPIQQLEAWNKQVEDNPCADTADLDVAKRLLKHGIEASKEIQRLREALSEICDYWNRDQNSEAMYDACWHAINVSNRALSGENK